MLKVIYNQDAAHVVCLLRRAAVDPCTFNHGDDNAQFQNETLSIEQIVVSMSTKESGDYGQKNGKDLVKGLRDLQTGKTTRQYPVCSEKERKAKSSQSKNYMIEENNVFCIVSAQIGSG